ncbi:MAG: biopolymer transporter ExbD [Bdellovibrionaceae bacterium]|nr:biopolymer transporter ExbD [Pseudobdellovibrionaceae bacterium]NUM58161.1 biopolymer transporter ExbD [Pseudobdellovibrionaceae bacterium]
MRNLSVLQRQMFKSPILAQGLIKPSSSDQKSKNLYFSMNLTTLIDAFCILVIFLLSNMNGQLQNVNIGKDIKLPIAEKTEILNTGITLRIEKDSLYLDETKISMEELTNKLIQLKNKGPKSLIIQADKDSDFEQLSYALRAGSQAGYEKYAFAVLPGKVK